jgi:hypothetical protein
MCSPHKQQQQLETEVAMLLAALAMAVQPGVVGAVVAL